MSHASGLGLNSDAILSRPGRRRIYSNRGIEIVAEAVAARGGKSFELLLGDEICLPLGLLYTRLDGSPSWGAAGPLSDLVTLAIELLSPSLVDAELLAEATRTAFPCLSGVLPGFGRQPLLDWGLGFEIRDGKVPHLSTPRLAGRQRRRHGHWRNAARGDRSGYLRQATRDLACQQLRAALIAVWGEVPDDRLVQKHTERGPPGWVLVSLACRPGDVLVVGAGRRGTLARMAFSKVSRYCLAHAQCPVLAIPPPALARELRHGRLAWVFWHRQLTAEQVLRDQGRPAA